VGWKKEGGESCIIKEGEKAMSLDGGSVEANFLFENLVDNKAILKRRRVQSWQRKLKK
jgi:hypothetical protein